MKKLATLHVYLDPMEPQSSGVGEIPPTQHDAQLAIAQIKKKIESDPRLAGNTIISMPTPSDYSVGTEGERVFKLVLTGQQGQGPSVHKTLLDYQTTLAHELGHFICLVTGDPTHADNKFRRYQATNDISALMPMELKAWELAHTIKPDLDAQREKDALGTYEQGVADTKANRSMGDIMELVMQFKGDRENRAKLLQCLGRSLAKAARANGSERAGKLFDQLATLDPSNRIAATDALRSLDRETRLSSFIKPGDLESAYGEMRKLAFTLDAPNWAGDSEPIAAKVG